jgi:hypothetical protein
MVEVKGAGDSTVLFPRLSMASLGGHHARRRRRHKQPEKTVEEENEQQLADAEAEEKQVVEEGSKKVEKEKRVEDVDSFSVTSAGRQMVEAEMFAEAVRGAGE